MPSSILPRSPFGVRRLRSSPFLWIIALVPLIANSAFGQAELMLNCVADSESPLPAECESFAFQIRVTQVIQTPPLLSDTAPGDILTGTFTVDGGAPDVVPLTNEGFYANALECVTLDVGDRLVIIDHEPIEVSLPPDTADRGIGVMNDIDQPTEIGLLFTDTASFGIAGPSVIRPEDGNSAGVRGGGGIAFSYAEACFTDFQSPCPPTILTGDGLPEAPGTFDPINGAQLVFDFLSFANEPALIQSELLSITNTPPIACPEPSLGLSIAAVLPWAAALGRRRFRVA